MAPEALTGDLLEGTANLVDVYGLGVVGFELLTGVVPFDGQEPLDLYRAKTRSPLPRVSDFRSDVPAPLDALMAQLMSADSSERPQGAEAALWQLRALRSRHRLGFIDLR